MDIPLIDVIIPVHSATRPVRRAAASVLDGTRAAVRVNVVAHNIDPEVIESNLGDLLTDERLRLLPFHDGIASPAGPMNHGIDNATARFISVMGSDDELAAGAIDSWLALQRDTGASTVLARIRISGRGSDPYPPVRNGRRQRRLDARKDRLAYRSAPLGIVDRERFQDLRFTEGLPSGEDLAYSATLWFTGEQIAYDLHGPAYLVNDDADDRVTFSGRSVAEDFAFLDAIEAMQWYPSLGARERQALAVKILRVHFFDAVLARVNAPDGLSAQRDDLTDVLGRVERMAPGVLSLLARVDRLVIDEVRAAAPNAARVLHLLDARWNYRTIGALLPRNPFLVLHRQAPFRTLYAGLRASTTA
ncbi:glycosyltransferase [Microbacterium sp. WCS2018Hpa-23]|uniref:glycosyltransferase n=1 Tax=Microbacterium sp. WCS2018Hpa-23 TaxID=3073634 RepID=UPI002883335F|nr:glycosyltransferase [Microbacterium sp. WCS2018Hpa-23]